MAGTFVGRVRQLLEASDAVDSAARGHGSAIVVTGEAGIGKTRFAREVADVARAQGMEVVWAAGWPAGGAPAYWPWPEILDAVAPSVGASLDADPGAAERERFDRFRDVADLLWRRADVCPVLVVIDDVQAVDADGLLLTRFVAQGTPTHPVLLLLTQRTGQGPPTAAADLLEHVGRSGTTFRLDELNPDEVAALIESHGQVADDAVVQRVAELTGGVPFLVEVVLDAGLHRRPGPVPDPARRLVQGRLGELTDDERSVVEAAAVLGPPLVPAALAPIADCDPAGVLAACRHACDLGLLRATGVMAFAFPHDLAREAVVAGVEAERLADLHRRCLVALAGASPTPPRASRRAHHAVELTRSSTADIAEAIATLRESAGVLGVHGAPEAAVELLETAVELQEGDLAGPVAPLLVELGSALLATGRLGSSRVAFGRAVQEAVDEEAVTLARAALGLGGVWVMEHRTIEGWSGYLELLGRALDAAGDDPALAAALRLRIAAERAAVGAIEVDEVLTAMDVLRSDGTPADLVAGLSLLHHLMMGPPHAHDRVAVADELVERARAIGDDLHL